MPCVLTSSRGPGPMVCLLQIILGKFTHSLTHSLNNGDTFDTHYGSTMTQERVRLGNPLSTKCSEQ
jgi:hypothetical protein